MAGQRRTCQTCKRSLHPNEFGEGFRGRWECLHCKGVPMPPPPPPGAPSLSSHLVPEVPKASRKVTRGRARGVKRKAPGEEGSDLEASGEDRAQTLQYNALLDAAQHNFQPTLQAGNVQALLLGGHTSASSTLFVACMCSSCKPNRSRGTVFSLEEFCSHAGTTIVEDIVVMQPGNFPPVPLNMWLRAGALLMGGSQLVGCTLWIFWYAERQECVREVYGKWYQAIIRDFTHLSGEHRINYRATDGSGWEAEDFLVFLPAAHVHFKDHRPGRNEVPASLPPGKKHLCLMRLRTGPGNVWEALYSGGGGKGEGAVEAVLAPAPRLPPMGKRKGKTAMYGPPPLMPQGLQKLGCLIQGSSSGESEWEDEEQGAEAEEGGGHGSRGRGQGRGSRGRGQSCKEGAAVKRARVGGSGGGSGGGAGGGKGNREFGEGPMEHEAPGDEHGTGQDSDDSDLPLDGDYRPSWGRGRGRGRGRGWGRGRRQEEGAEASFGAMLSGRGRGRGSQGRGGGRSGGSRRLVPPGNLLEHPTGARVLSTAHARFGGLPARPMLRGAAVPPPHGWQSGSDDQETDDDGDNGFHAPHVPASLPPPQPPTWRQGVASVFMPDSPPSAPLSGLPPAIPLGRPLTGRGSRGGRMGPPRSGSGSGRGLGRGGSRDGASAPVAWSLARRTGPRSAKSVFESWAMEMGMELMPRSRGRPSRQHYLEQASWEHKVELAWRQRDPQHTEGSSLPPAPPPGRDAAPPAQGAGARPAQEDSLTTRTAAHAGPMRTGGEPTHPMGAAGGVRNYLHPSQAPVPGTGPAQPAPPPSSASAPVSAEESRKAAGPLQNRPHTTAISPPPPPRIIVPLAAPRPPQALGGASRAALLAPQPAVAGPIAPHPNALPQQQMAANSCSSGATQLEGLFPGGRPNLNLLTAGLPPKDLARLLDIERHSRDPALQALSCFNVELSPKATCAWQNTAIQRRPMGGGGPLQGGGYEDNRLMQGPAGDGLGAGKGVGAMLRRQLIQMGEDVMQRGQGMQGTGHQAGGQVSHQSQPQHGGERDCNGVQRSELRMRVQHAAAGHDNLFPTQLAHLQQHPGLPGNCNDPCDMQSLHEAKLGLNSHGSPCDLMHSSSPQDGSLTEERLSLAWGAAHKSPTGRNSADPHNTHSPASAHNPPTVHKRLSGSSQDVTHPWPCYGNLPPAPLGGGGEGGQGGAVGIGRQDSWSPLTLPAGFVSVDGLLLPHGGCFGRAIGRGQSGNPSQHPAPPPGQNKDNIVANPGWPREGRAGGGAAEPHATVVAHVQPPSLQQQKGGSLGAGQEGQVPLPPQRGGEGQQQPKRNSSGWAQADCVTPSSMGQRSSQQTEKSKRITRGSATLLAAGGSQLAVPQAPQHQEPAQRRGAPLQRSLMLRQPMRHSAGGMGTGQPAMGMGRGSTGRMGLGQQQGFRSHEGRPFRFTGALMLRNNPNSSCPSALHSPAPPCSRAWAREGHGSEGKASGMGSQPTSLRLGGWQQKRSGGHRRRDPRDPLSRPQWDGPDPRDPTSFGWWGAEVEASRGGGQQGGQRPWNSLWGAAEGLRRRVRSRLTSWHGPAEDAEAPGGRRWSGGEGGEPGSGGEGWGMEEDPMEISPGAQLPSPRVVLRALHHLQSLDPKQTGAGGGQGAAAGAPLNIAVPGAQEGGAAPVEAEVLTAVPSQAELGALAAALGASRAEGLNGAPPAPTSGGGAGEPPMTTASALAALIALLRSHPQLQGPGGDGLIRPQRPTFLPGNASDNSECRGVGTGRLLGLECPSPGQLLFLGAGGLSGGGGGDLLMMGQTHADLGQGSLFPTDRSLLPNRFLGPPSASLREGWGRPAGSSGGGTNPAPSRPAHSLGPSIPDSGGGAPSGENLHDLIGGLSSGGGAALGGGQDDLMRGMGELGAPSCTMSGLGGVGATSWGDPLAPLLQDPGEWDSAAWSSLGAPPLQAASQLPGMGPSHTPSFSLQAASHLPSLGPSHTPSFSQKKDAASHLPHLAPSHTPSFSLLAPPLTPTLPASASAALLTPTSLGGAAPTLPPLPPPSPLNDLHDPPGPTASPHSELPAPAPLAIQL